MRVVVNRLVASGRKTGIGYYTSELLRCLAAQTSDGEVAGFPGPLMQSARDAWTRVGDWLHKHETTPSAAQPGTPCSPGIKARLVGSLRRLARTAITWHFRAACARGQYELYHEPNFIPLPSELPTVATLHDLSVVLYPEWHPAHRVKHFEQHFRHGLSQCVHFLSISENGRQEIIRHLGIAPQRVTCTYMGVRPGLGPLPAAETESVLRQLQLPTNYLLYLGTIEPRKNVLRLMQAYCALPAALRDRWPLLLVGGWGWNTAPVAEYLHNEARHRGVQYLGYVAEEHLPALYNGARALVYPSLYEGFGIPPIEMMACGGAVLASTAGAVAETAGGQAHLVDPHDTDGWRDALQRVLTDDDWWRQLRRGACEAARPYTWDRCAADTLAVYRRLTGQAVNVTSLPQYRAAG